MLITAGVQGSFIVHLNIHYTYPPRQAVLLNPKGDSISVELLKAQHFDPHSKTWKTSDQV